MTKEELEKEAKEYAKKNGNCFSEAYGIRCRTYLDCAEPREKRIAELEEENKHIYARMTRIDKVLDEKIASIAELEAQIEKMQEKLKADLIAKLEEQIQYSTSPSCTKGMELFIKSIEEWEIKEND